MRVLRIFWQGLFLGLFFSALILWPVMLQAAIFNTSGPLFNNVAYSSTALITSDDLYATPGATRVDCYLFATTAGSFQPNYIDINGNVRAIGPAVSINASAPTDIHFPFNFPKSRYQWTPSSSPGNIFLDCFASAPQR